MAKLKTRVVTGYVPLPSHPRSMAEYEALGQRLSDALGDHPLAVYYQRIPELWMTQFLEKLEPMQPPLSWAKGDNPQKNTLEYHAIQHQKFEWLKRAMLEDSESDTFIWMDYGIFSQPGMDAENVRTFLRKIRREDFAIPGCWPESKDFNDEYPCWRFCGSLLIVPRAQIMRLHGCTTAMARLQTRLMKKVTFEINTLARVEPMLRLGGLRWYHADHNVSMLARYAE